MPSFKSIPIILGKLRRGDQKHFRAPKSPVQIGLDKITILFNTVPN